MGFYGKLFSRDRDKPEPINFGFSSSEFTQALKGYNTTRKSEATYFRCLKILSESISKLPIKVYQKRDGNSKQIEHNINDLIKIQPNNIMNANIFWSTVELNRNHYGNAYVYIKRNKKSFIESLWVLETSKMKIIVDDANVFENGYKIYYMYTEKDEPEILYSDEILHFKSWITYKEMGILGLSVQEIMKTYIDRGVNANTFISKLTKDGMITDKIVLQYTGNMDGDARNALINAMKNNKGNGKFFTLPLGVTATNLQSKLTDSQFLELSKYNAIQIAQAFGINPQMIGDWEKGNFANAGVQSQMFYKDTLLSILTQYEQEMEIKLLTKKERMQGFYFKFNVDSLLRGAFKERIDAYATAINSGILTANECRELEDREGKEGGDNLVANGNMMKLIDASIQYRKEK